MLGSDGPEIGIIMIPGANYPGERYIPLGKGSRKKISSLNGRAIGRNPPSSLMAVGNQL